MIYNSHVTLVTQHALLQPDQSQVIAPCSQALTIHSFTSDEPCAHFLDYHSYLACLYFTFQEYKFPPRFQLSCIYLTSHICFTPFCVFSLYCITPPHSPTTFTSYATPGDDPLPPDHTLRASLGLCLGRSLHPILAAPLAYQHILENSTGCITVTTVQSLVTNYNQRLK